MKRKSEFFIISPLCICAAYSTIKFLFYYETQVWVREKDRKTSVYNEQLID